MDTKSKKHVKLYFVSQEGCNLVGVDDCMKMAYQVFMGIFYQVRSVALAEDLPGIHDKVFNTVEEFYTAADAGYSLNAMNCWIAACLYLVTLFVSGHQFYVNSRSSL